MTTLFISHSSADNAAAARLRERLRERGYLSLFLDFDPEQGIQAGRDWEQELYLKLRQCQALLILCSPASMSSQWCFGELVYARAEGKPVLPLVLAPCELPFVLARLQTLDFTEQDGRAYERLFNALEANGLDPAGSFPWDPKRPPYPGLAPFEAEDAAVFFGRGAEISAAQEALNRVLRRNDTRLVLILGSSGAGKSSLLRAGLLPRLAVGGEDFRLIGPFRPAGHPLTELAAAIDPATRSRDPQALRSLIGSPAQGDPMPAAGVLLAIDQLEEAFTQGDPEESRAFLELVRTLITDRDASVTVVATLRSDYLGALQQHPALSGFPMDAAEKVLVGPLPPDRLIDIITRPAQVAGLRLEAGLADALVSDADSRHALPLLAFTLRELWEARSAEGHTLTLDHYRDRLGGLRACIARVAQSVLDSLEPDQADRERLRRAFCRMAMLDESGTHIRRPLNLVDLDARTRELLLPFVERRLLVLREAGQTLEVAHEALFQEWALMRHWLTGDRAFQDWRARLQTPLAQWEAAEDPDGWLLSDDPLAEARRWLDDRREDLDTQEIAYLEASDARDRARIERKRITRQRLQRLKNGLLMVLAAATLISAGLGGVAYWQRQEALEQSHLAQRSLAQSHWSRGALARAAGDDLSAGHWFAQAAASAHETGDAGDQRWARAALTAAAALPGEYAFAGSHELGLQPRGMSASGDALITWDRSHVLVWDADAARVRLKAEAPQVRGALLNGPDRLITWGGDGALRSWELTGGTEQTQVWHEESVRGAAVETGRGRLISWDDAGLMMQFDLAAWPEIVGQYRHDDRINGALFMPDGRGLLSWSRDRTARLWQSEAGQARVVLAHPAEVLDGMISPDGSRVVTRDLGASVFVWQSSDGALLRTFDAAAAAPVERLAFHPDGRRLILATVEGAILLWDPDTEAPPELLARHPGTPTGLIPQPGRTGIASWAERGEVLLSKLDGGRPLSLSRQAPTLDLRFDPGNPRRLLSWGTDDAAMLWDATLAVPVSLPMLHPQGLRGAMFTTDGQRIVTLDRAGGLRVWERREPRHVTALEFEEQPLAARITASGDVAIALDGGALLLWKPGQQAEPRNPGRTPPEHRILATAANGHLLVWGRDTGLYLLNPPDGAVEALPWPRNAQGQAIVSASFDPAGERVAVATDDGRVSVWFLTSLDQPATLPHTPTRPLRLRFSPDGTALLTWSEDFRLRLWDLASGELIGEPIPLESEPTGFQVTGDRSVLYFEGVRWWLHEPSRIPTAPTGEQDNGIQAAVLDPRGERLLTGDANGRITLWTWSGEKLSVFDFDAPVQEMIWHPTEDWFLVRSRRQWQAWDLIAGLALTRRHMHPLEIASAQFSKAGDAVLTAGGFHVVLWSLPPLQPVPEAPVVTQNRRSGTVFDPVTGTVAPIGD